MKQHWEQLGSLCTAAADLVLGPCASGDDATQIWAAGGGGSASAANAGAECSRGQVPVGHAQSRAISSIIGVQLNASRNEASQGAASLDASPHTLAVRRHAMKRAPFCQIGQSQFIL